MTSLSITLERKRAAYFSWSSFNWRFSRTIISPLIFFYAYLFIFFFFSFVLYLGLLPYTFVMDKTVFFFDFSNRFRFFLFSLSLSFYLFFLLYSIPPDFKFSNCTTCPFSLLFCTQTRILKKFILPFFSGFCGLSLVFHFFTIFLLLFV